MTGGVEVLKPCLLTAPRRANPGDIASTYRPPMKSLCWVANGASARPCGVLIYFPSTGERLATGWSHWARVALTRPPSDGAQLVQMVSRKGVPK
jgi:hypothetical protein